MPISKQLIDELVDLVDESRLVEGLSSMIAVPSVNPFEEPVSENCRELEFAESYLQHMNAVGLDTFKRDVADGRPHVF